MSVKTPTQLVLWDSIVWNSTHDITAATTCTPGHSSLHTPLQTAQSLMQCTMKGHNTYLAACRPWHPQTTPTTLTLYISTSYHDSISSGGTAVCTAAFYIFRITLSLAFFSFFFFSGDSLSAGAGGRFFDTFAFRASGTAWKQEMHS